jgi:hypothetical protein
MWSLFARKTILEVEVEECAPPVSAFEKADCDSVRPFEAECIMGVVTYRGVKHEFQKPDGRYHLGNPDLIARNRERKVEQFYEIVRRLEARGTPTSGVRVKAENHNKLKGTGT